MKRGSTNILRTALVLLGVIVAALCVFAVPPVMESIVIEYPYAASWQWPITIGIYLTAVAFFMALYQAMHILHLIDKEKAFTKQAAKALQRIKYCAVAISLIYVSFLPALYQVADREDAPGLIVMGAGWTLAPLVIGVFAAVLQRLVETARTIKSEHDLTV